MSAHVKQVHEAVMEKHADEIAENFVDSLSSKEKGKLREQFNRIDAKGIDLNYEKPTSPVSMEESMKMFSEAMNEVNEKIERMNNEKSDISEADTTAADASHDHEGDDGAGLSSGIRTHGMNQRVQQARGAAAAMHEAKKGWNKKSKPRKK